MASALPVATGDEFLLILFLLYAHVACITWMASDMMSKTASITTRTQATVSLGYIWLLLDDSRDLPGSSSLKLSAPRNRDQMTQFSTLYVLYYVLTNVYL